MSQKIYLPKRLALSDRLRIPEALGQSPTKGVPPTPPPPGVFDVGVALSGLEDNGGTPSNPEMSYFVSKNLIKQRIPFSWFAAQPLAFGSIEPNYFAQISSVLASAQAAGSKVILDVHNFGAGPAINGLFYSSAIGTKDGSGLGWDLSGNSSALPVITANAGPDPAGGNTASKIVFPAVTSAWSELNQHFNLGPGPATFYVSLQGAVGGEVTYISIISDPNITFHTTRCVLTTSIQQFAVTATLPGGTCYFNIGTDLRDPVQSATPIQTVYASFAQAQAGSSATTYAPNTNSTANYKLGTVQCPRSALANFWVAFSTALRADPNYSVVFGYDVMNEWSNMDPNSSAPSTPYSQALILDCNTQVLTALRAAGDTSRLYLEWDHFSGAWDAVTNNISGLMDLVLSDPIHNSCVDVHCYLDQDSSGTHYVASSVFGQPSTAPPGITVTTNIGPDRMAAVTGLANSKGCPLCLGETGWSNDNFAFGGANNYGEWNEAGRNMLEFCKANTIEVLYFAGGPGFAPNYPYIPSPSSTATYFVSKDFTSAGLQASQMVIFDQYSGFTGSQPVGYASYLPFGVFPYTPSGTPLPGFTLQYNANITSPVNFTGHAHLADGTDVGGTFTPISISPGLNGTASFSYTPAGTYQSIKLTFTNDTGLTDPPAIGVSSELSFFNTVGAIAPNVYSLRLWNFVYVGLALTLRRPQDNATRSFSFDVNGNLPRQAIQDWGNSRVFGIVEWFDQSGNGNNLIFDPGTINLIMVDTDGYPSVSIPTSAVNPSGGAVNFSTPSIGQGQLSVYAESNPISGGMIVSQDEFLDDYRITYAAFDVGPNDGSRTFVNLGGTPSTWQTLTGTYSNAYGTNNLKGYLNGSLNQQATAPQFVNSANNNTCTFGTFQFFSIPYQGKLRSVIIQYLEYSSTLVGTANTNYTNYIGTALPDSLSAVAPTIVGGSIPATFFTGGVGSPLTTVSILDYNSGSPTDTLVITLSGAAATLTGSGITGSNPYTIAAASAASVTATLQALTLNTSASAGSVVNIQIAATSSAGPSTSTTMPVTLATFGIETAFTPPAGTFTPVGNFKGYNLAGGEETGGQQWPAHFQIDYAASKGFGLIRLPIMTLSQMYQSAQIFSPLNVANITALKAVIDYAFTKNLYVLLDYHNNGFGYIGGDFASGGSYAFVGANASATNSYADTMSRLASRFKNYPNVMWGMMNEPNHQTATQWQTGMQPAINALRAAGATQKLLIPAGGLSYFQGAHDWTSSGNAALYVGWAGDPLNNFWFDIHQYLDSDNSGTSPFAVVGYGATCLDLAGTGLCTTWMRAHGYKAFLSEFGFAPDPWKGGAFGDPNAYLSTATPVTTHGISEGSAQVGYMTSNSDVWAGWSMWAGGIEFGTPPTDGGYGYNPEPQRNGTLGYVIPVTDQPQMAVLTANI